MIKIKWGLIPGAVAFALALLTSLVLGQTSFMIALLRAVVFAAVFFGLGIGIRALIGNFIPELLISGKKEDDAVGNVFSGTPGSRVNITVDDAPDPALPQQDDSGAASAKVGNFNDLLSGSIRKAAYSAAQDVDQTPENDYTTEDKAEEFAPVFEKAKLDDIGDFSMDFGAFVSDDYSGGETGGSDSDMDSFSFFPGTDSSSNLPDTPEPERKPSGNKPMQLEGDFDPKEIAAGIRTVLKKEKG